MSRTYRFMAGSCLLPVGCGWGVGAAGGRPCRQRFGWWPIGLGPVGRGWPVDRGWVGRASGVVVLGWCGRVGHRVEWRRQVEAGGLGEETAEFGGAGSADA